MANTKMKIQIRLILLQKNIFKVVRSTVILHDRCVRSKKIHNKFLQYLDELELEMLYNITIPLTSLLSPVAFEHLPGEIKIRLLAIGICPLCGFTIVINDLQAKLECGGCKYVFKI